MILANIITAIIERMRHSIVYSILDMVNIRQLSVECYHFNQKCQCGNGLYLQLWNRICMMAQYYKTHSVKKTYKRTSWDGSGVSKHVQPPHRSTCRVHGTSNRPIIYCLVHFHLRYKFWGLSLTTQFCLNATLSYKSFIVYFWVAPTSLLPFRSITDITDPTTIPSFLSPTPRSFIPNQTWLELEAPHHDTWFQQDSS